MTSTLDRHISKTTKGTSRETFLTHFKTTLPKQFCEHSFCMFLQRFSCTYFLPFPWPNLPPPSPKPANFRSCPGLKYLPLFALLCLLLAPVLARLFPFACFLLRSTVSPSLSLSFWFSQFSTGAVRGVESWMRSGLLHSADNRPGLESMMAKHGLQLQERSLILQRAALTKLSLPGYCGWLARYTLYIVHQQHCY